MCDADKDVQVWRQKKCIAEMTEVTKKANSSEADINGAFRPEECAIQVAVDSQNINNKTIL